MKVSLCLTINNRSPFISDIVAHSFRLPGNSVDETVVVLDTPIPASESGARRAYGGAKFINIDGPVRWKNPSAAWNMAFAVATGDILYCISSETVQYPGNVELAKNHMVQGGVAVFGKVIDSMGEVYCSSEMCRPLGTIMAIPKKNVAEIGGYDERYMAGLCFEDADFTYRLWRSGLDFVFDDRVTGVHIAHNRDTNSFDGLTRKALNAQLSVETYGLKNMTPFGPEPMPWWPSEKMTISKTPGLTTWSHI